MILPLLASALAILAEGIYIHSILQGKTKPSFSGWLVFTVAMVCVLVSAYAMGARESLFLIATFTILHAVVTLLSIKYGVVRLTRLDTLLLVLSAIGVYLWWLTSDPLYMLIINVLIDMFGYVLMTKKLYVHPQTEDPPAWALSIAAYLLNLLIITHWAPEEYLFSLSNAFWCSVMFILALRRLK